MSKLFFVIPLKENFPVNPQLSSRSLLTYHEPLYFNINLSFIRWCNAAALLSLREVSAVLICLFLWPSHPFCSSAGSSFTATSNELPLALFRLPHGLLPSSLAAGSVLSVGQFHHPHPRFSDMYLHILSSRFLSSVGKIEFCYPSR